MLKITRTGEGDELSWKRVRVTMETNKVQTKQ